MWGRGIPCGRCRLCSGGLEGTYLASSSGRQRDVVPEKPCHYREKSLLAPGGWTFRKERHGVGRDRACKGAILAFVIRGSTVSTS